MNTFKERYVHRCKELGIEPSQTVLGQCRDHSDKDAPVLALHGFSLASKMCAALAYALAEDVVFKKLIVGDCFLGDDGCILIANALRTNKGLEFIDLRGNNIRADGAIALSQALRINSTLKHLSLEWNCIGIWESGVKAVADALSVNNTLRSLDLRNNRIAPQAIQYLAMSLKHNTSLKRLDLRWNNAGTIGGKALLELVTWQDRFLELEVAGNEIPEDILAAIDTATAKNRENQLRTNHIHSFQIEMSSTIESMTKAHHQTLSDYKKQLDSTVGEKLSLTERLSLASLELVSAQDVQRMMEKRIKDLETENVDLMKRLDTRKIEWTNSMSDIQKALVVEREKRLQSSEDHEKHAHTLQKEKAELESQLSDVKLRLEVYKKDKSILVEQLDHLRSRETEIIAVSDEKIKRVEANYIEKIKLIESAHQRELNEKQDKLDQKLKAMQQQMEKLECTLEEEKTKFNDKKKAMEVKSTELEHVQQEQLKSMKKEHEMQLISLEKQLENLHQQIAQLTRNHAQALLEAEQEMMNKSSSQKKELMHEIASLQIKIKTLCTENEEMNMVVHRFKEKESELNAMVGQVKRESKSQLDELIAEVQSLKAKKQELEESLAKKNDKITALQEEIQELKEELDDKDEEYLVKMKELQVSINQLMEKRSKRSATHVHRDTALAS